MKRSLILLIVSLLLFFVIYPAAFLHPQTTLPDNNDTRLIAYIIGQVQDNLLNHHPLFFGRFFAPDQNTLAYSDLFLTTSILTLPFRLFTDSAVVIYNTALILSFSLTFITSFFLFNYIFANFWISILSTLLFNLSGFHFSYLPHLQMFSLWPLCLSLYFFLRFQKEKRSLFLHLFFITFTLQVAESIFAAYLIFFTAFFLHFLSPHRRPIKTFIPYLALYLPIWILITLPYLRLHRSFAEATRPIRDAAHFSLGLEEIFTKYHGWTITILFLLSSLTSKTINAPKTLINKLMKAFVSFCELTSIKKANFKSRFRGLFTTFRRQKLLGFLRSRKIFVENRDDRLSQEQTNYRSLIKTADTTWIKWAKTIFFFSLIMSLGPVLKAFGQTIKIFELPIPLPYALFYYLFPGFTGFRTPSRFIILALLAAAIIIGYQLTPLFNKIKTKTRFIFLTLTFSLLLYELRPPITSFPVETTLPSVYQEVKNLPSESIILELPVKLWNDEGHEIESIRSLYSLEHKHRRFGGFSGFATQKWIDLVQQINTYGLNSQNLRALHFLGVTHVVNQNKLYPLPPK
jgi:hypothetical protein